MQPGAIPDSLFARWRITLPLRELTQFPGMVFRHYRHQLARAVPREKPTFSPLEAQLKTMTNGQQDLMSAEDEYHATHARTVGAALLNSSACPFVLVSAFGLQFAKLYISSVE